MRSLAALLVSLAVLGLAACSSTPDEKDETIRWTVDQLYNEAKQAMTEGGYDRAVKYYEKLEARFPYGRYAQQAQLEVAYAYYKQNEPGSAISACERFIRLHPNHPSVDYAYYLKGLVNFNEDAGLLAMLGSYDLSDLDPKAARESYETFKELIQRFPDSRYANDAHQRMAYLVEAMAAHEVHVADYYLRRGNYVAVINRAQFAINTFPTAPANEQALALMVRAYDALGITDLRDDTVRVLRKNFPNSAYLSAYQTSERPWWRLW